MCGGGGDGTGEKGPMTEQFRQGRWGYRNARGKDKRSMREQWDNDSIWGYDRARGRLCWLMSMPELGRQTQNVAFCLQFVPLMTAATGRKDP